MNDDTSSGANTPDTQSERDDISDASGGYGDRDQGFSEKSDSSYDGQRGRNARVHRGSDGVSLRGKSGGRLAGNGKGGKPESVKDHLVKKPWKKLDVGGYLDAIAKAGKGSNVWLHQAFTAVTQGIQNLLSAAFEFAKGAFSASPKAGEKFMERRERKTREKEGVSRSISPDLSLSTTRNIAPATAQQQAPQVPGASYYYGPPPGGPGAGPAPFAGHGLGPAAQGMSDGVSGGYVPAPAHAPQQHQQPHQQFGGFYAPGQSQTVDAKRASGIGDGRLSSRYNTVDEKRAATLPNGQPADKSKEGKEKKEEKAASSEDEVYSHKKKERDTEKNPSEKHIKDIATGKKKVGENAKGKPEVEKKPPLSTTLQGSVGTVFDPNIKPRSSQKSASTKEKPALSPEQKAIATKFGADMERALVSLNGRAKVERFAGLPSGPGCTPPRSTMPERAQQTGLAY